MVGRLREGAEAAASTAISVIGKVIFEALAERAGRMGITDGVWTNWHTAAENAPERLRPSLQILKLAFMRNSLFANNLVRPYPEGAKTAFVVTRRRPAGVGALAGAPPTGAGTTSTGTPTAATTRWSARRTPGSSATSATTSGSPRSRPRANPGTNPVSVREVSRARCFAPHGRAQEVPFLNLWAAAWIQFMTHDWVSHGSGRPEARAERVPLADDDPLRALRRRAPRLSAATLARPHAPEQRRGDGRRRSSTRSRTGGTARRSTAATSSHAAIGFAAVDGGKLTVTDEGCLPRRPASRHRADRLRPQLVGRPRRASTRCSPASTTRSATISPAAYPAWDDEALFQTARLVNAARDGEDPHGGVDAGDPAQPARSTTDARELVRRCSRSLRWRRASRPSRRSRSATPSSAASSVDAAGGLRQVRPAARSSPPSTACTRCCPT